MKVKLSALIISVLLMSLLFSSCGDALPKECQEYHPLKTSGDLLAFIEHKSPAAI